MNEINNPAVARVFKNYPQAVLENILVLRRLIFSAALEIEAVEELEETLKWGEPSYLTKDGSTIRIGWKKSKPDQYGLYFHCQTSLVDTFRALYGSDLVYEGNRAIIFNVGDKIPAEAVKFCIGLALTYHRRKHLPTLEG